ncbi:MAG: hypothetical protein ACFFDN_29860, partial [Candidatus Hodarchaeota archaeon]
MEKLKSEGYVAFTSHNHTNFSDGADYRYVIDKLIKTGANLIALTDHNNMRVAKYAESYIKEKYPECQYLTGEEIDSEYGDVLAYGLQEEILLEGGDKLPIKEIIDIIHDQGGLAVIAHPFHPIEGIFRTFGGLNTSEIINFEFDGIEYFHADLPPFLNYMCASLLKLKPRLFILGADDAHSIHHIGRYLTLIGPGISDVHNIDEIYKALKQNKTTVLELGSWASRSFEMLPGFMDIIINQGLKRINAFAGIYGLFKGIHFQQESMGWNPITLNEFEDVLQELMQSININTIRLDGMRPETNVYKFAESAKELGLNVILAPKYVYPDGIDKPQLDSSLTYDEFEDFCLDHAQRAQSIGTDIFCIGNELTLELSDDKSGHVERFNPDFFIQFTPSSLEMIPGLGSSALAKLGKIGKKRPKILKYLEKLGKKVKGHFDGMVSYASAAWEIRDVPWKSFDVICSNLYFSDLLLEFVEILPGIKIKTPKGSHSVRASHLFRQNIQYLKKFKKPVIISELGFQTVGDPIRLGSIPLKYHKDFNQLKYDENAQSQAFSDVFKLLIKDIFVNGVIIHEWKDHEDTGFGIVRHDGTPKKAYGTIA